MSATMKHMAESHELTPNPDSHRERVKAQRRRDIELAALRLFGTQGYEKTTIAEIAREAGVAPRTVPTYFSSKSELVTVRQDESAERLRSRLENRAPHENIIDIFEAWIEAEVIETDPEIRRLRVIALDRNPALRSVASPASDSILHYGVQLLSDHLDCPVNHPAIAVALAATKGLLEQMETLTEHYDPQQVQALIRAFLRAGFIGIGSAVTTLREPPQ